MALQENVGVRLSYKAYPTGAFTANTKEDIGSQPGAIGAQQLRRVSSTLSLGKDTYESNEIRTDRQRADWRHGVARVTGEISGELSPATYWDLIEAVMRGTEEASFSKTQADLTSMAADNTTSKFTVGGSTWALQGFRVGDIIRQSTLSESANNDTNFQIYALNGVDAFVTPAPTTMGADTSFTVTRIGKKIVIPTSSHVKRKFAFEHYFEDIDIAELFTECRVHRMAVGLPATGLATIAFGVTGRDAEILDGSRAPYFASPTEANANGITAAVNGKIIFDGAVVGVVTGIDFALEQAVDAPPVVGQNFVPDIFLGRLLVNGNLTALLEDATFLDAFKNETIVEIIGNLTVTSAGNSPVIGFAMTRVKLGGANLPLQGEGGLPITCPFQALIKESATGYDQTTLMLIDSEA